MTDKLIRDGKVAVLVSHGFGAGWSTWAEDNREAMLFDPDLARAIEANEPLEPIAERKYPDQYAGGLRNLCVQWLPIGTIFRIDEFDGSEAITTTEALTYTA
jgi:hypothetical protein